MRSGPEPCTPLKRMLLAIIMSVTDGSDGVSAGDGFKRDQGGRTKRFNIALDGGDFLVRESIYIALARKVTGDGQQLSIASLMDTGNIAATHFAHPIWVAAIQVNAQVADALWAWLDEQIQRRPKQ